MNKNPIKAKIHKPNTAMSINELNKIGNVKLEKEAKSQKEIIEAKQIAIDDYNFNESFKIDEEFDNIQLTGNDIIVRLQKENFIKEVTYYADGEPMYDAWISQVDGRMRQHDPERWVDNPLPYIFTGVIVAISPSAKAQFLKTKKSLEEVDSVLASEYIIPTVGDLVNLEPFMIADKRFYMHKQKRDFIKNPHEYKIEHWEGYVKISSLSIESIILNKGEYFENSSPFYRYYRQRTIN